MSTPQTPYRTPPPRTPQSRVTLRLAEPTLRDRDSIYHMPRGGDWLWLGLFALVVLGSAAYVWTQMGLDSDVGRAVFFAGVLLAILWTALIYTFKLSASVTVGPRGLSLMRGPWRTELTWAEVARMVERAKKAGGHSFRWLVALAHDGRELRIREDMVADYGRFRLEVYERYKLWQDHGGTWGATGGGPFSAEEDVANLVTWRLIAAGACLLPGLYFALLLPDTFTLGIALVALAALCALLGLRVSLGRQVYTVDRRAVTVSRPLGSRALAWSEMKDVERVRSRVRLLARVGILAGRALLAVAASADSRAESFTWSPRVPEYLVLRAVGGRRIRVRLHRLARPDELLAWIEFYDRVAREQRGRTHPASQPITPAPEPDLPDLASAAGPADPWAGRRGGEPEPESAGWFGATPPPREAAPIPDQPPVVAPQPAGPRATRPVLGGSGAENIDPRILAVIQDVAGAERSGIPGRSGAADTQRGGPSDWLNQSLDQGPFLRHPAPASPPEPSPSQEETLELPSASPYDYSAPPPPAPRPPAGQNGRGRESAGG